MAPGIGPGDPMIVCVTLFRGGNDYADTGTWLPAHRLILQLRCAAAQLGGHLPRPPLPENTRAPDKKPASNISNHIFFKTILHMDFAGI